MKKYFITQKKYVDCTKEELIEILKNGHKRIEGEIQERVNDKTRLANSLRGENEILRSNAKILNKDVETKQFEISVLENTIRYKGKKTFKVQIKWEVIEYDWESETWDTKVLKKIFHAYFFKSEVDGNNDISYLFINSDYEDEEYEDFESNEDSQKVLSLKIDGEEIIGDGGGLI